MAILTNTFLTRFSSESPNLEQNIKNAREHIRSMEETLLSGRVFIQPGTEYIPPEAK